MTIDITSSGMSETQVSDPQPVKGNAPIGAMPEKPTVTLEEALAQLEELKRSTAKLENEHRTASGELKRHRERLAKQELADKEKQDAELGELERTKKQYSETQTAYETYKQQTQELLVSYAIKEQAAQLRIIDLDAAVKLLDWSQLEYNEQGTPTNTKELLEDLVKKKSYLVPSAQAQEQPAQQKTPPALSAMNPQRKPSTTNSLAPGKITLNDVPWSRTVR